MRFYALPPCSQEYDSCHEGDSSQSIVIPQAANRVVSAQVVLSGMLKKFIVLKKVMQNMQK